MATVADWDTLADEILGPAVGAPNSPPDWDSLADDILDPDQSEPEWPDEPIPAAPTSLPPIIQDLPKEGERQVDRKVPLQPPAPKPPIQVEYGDNKVATFPHGTPKERILRTLRKHTADQRTLTPEQAGGRSQWIDSDKHTEMRKTTPVSQKGLEEYAEFFSSEDADGKPIVVKPEDVTPQMLEGVIKAREEYAADAAGDPIDLVALREFNEDTAAMKRDVDRPWSNETTVEHFARLIDKEMTPEEMVKAARTQGLEGDITPEKARAALIENRAAARIPEVVAADEEILGKRPGYREPEDKPHLPLPTGTPPTWTDTDMGGHAPANDNERMGQYKYTIAKSYSEIWAQTHPEWKDSNTESRLALLNQARTTYGLPEFRQLPGRLGWKAHSKTHAGRSGIAVPAVSELSGHMYNVRVQRAMESLQAAKEKGQEPRIGDMSIASEHMEEMAQLGRGLTVGGWTHAISLPMLKFMAEFTVGTAAVGKTVKGVHALSTTALARQTGTRVALLKLATQLGSKAKMGAYIGAKKGLVSRASGAVGGGLVAGVIRTPVLAPRIVEQTLTAMSPSYMPMIGDDKAVEVYLAKSPESFLKAATKAMGSAYIEMLSETSGYGMRAFKTAMLGQVMKRFGLKSVKQGIGILERMGYHGIVEEFGEERVSATMHAAFGLGEWSDVIPESQQALGELASFSVPSIGGASYSALVNKMNPRLTSKDVQAIKDRYKSGISPSRTEGKRWGMDAKDIKNTGTRRRWLNKTVAAIADHQVAQELEEIERQVAWEKYRTEDTEAQEEVAEEQPQAIEPTVEQPTAPEPPRDNYLRRGAAKAIAKIQQQRQAEAAVPEGEKQKPVVAETPEAAAEAETPAEEQEAAKIKQPVSGYDPGGILLFHGTDEAGRTAIDESGIIRGPAYLTSDADAANEYGGGAGATVYEVRVNPSELLVDFDLPGGRLLDVASANEYTGNEDWTIEDYIESGQSVGTQASVAIRKHSAPKKKRPDAKKAPVAEAPAKAEAAEETEAEEKRIRRTGAGSRGGVSVKVVPHRTSEGRFEVAVVKDGTRFYTGDYADIEGATEGAIDLLKSPGKVEPPAPPKTKPAEPAAEVPARKPITAKGDEIDLSGVSDQQLRHLSKQHKKTYDATDIGSAIASEIQSRGIKDYQEGPPEAAPLLEKKTAARNLREEKERAISTAHTQKNAVEQKLTIQSAQAHGVPLGGRGEYGLSAAKKWKKQVQAAKEWARRHEDYKAAEQAIEDAEAEVDRVKALEGEAELAYSREAGKDFPKVPEGQVRYAIESRGQAKVGKFDPERGQYQVESSGMKGWVSPQPLLDNYVSKEERDELNRIEQEYRDAKAKLNAQKAKRAEKERAKAEKTQLQESRKKARRDAASINYFRDLKERAKRVKTKKKQTIKIDDDKAVRPYTKTTGETWGDWGVAKVRDKEGLPVSHKEDGGVDLIHTPSGKIVQTFRNAPLAKQFAAMIDESGLDYAAARMEGEKTSWENLQQMFDAWGDENLSHIADEDLASKFTATPMEPGITADIILDSYDLGQHGTTQDMTDQGAGTVKQLVKDVPEFAYDPVFVVDNDGMLVFRDHYTFKFPPGLFNLHPSEIQSGQTVGINLPDLGLKLETSQAQVVAAVLNNEGYTAKSSGTSDRLTVRRGGKVFSVAKDRGKEWRVQGPDSAMEKDLQRLVGQIRWDHHSMREKIAVAREEVQPAPEPAALEGVEGKKTKRPPVSEHRAATGSATMRVGGIDVKPSAITSKMASSKQGRSLLKQLTDDSAKPRKWSVGRRSIFEFIAKALHSRLIVARSQVSRKHPGVYHEKPHVWFTKSGLDAPTNLHEAGHALLGLLKDFGELSEEFQAELTAFAEINQPPDGFASAVNPHEGMAELLRIWTTDPLSIPDSLRSQFESVVESRVPGTLDALKDARLAFLYNESRPPAQKFIANINDHRKRGERTPANQASAYWHALAQEVVGPSAAWTWLEKEIWRNMLGTQGVGAKLKGWFTKEGSKARRNANAVVREVMASLEDTPADVKTAQQLTFHVPSIVSNALYGTEEGTKGLRVHQVGSGFHGLPNAEEAIARLQAAGFEIPEAEGHGEWLALHPSSLEDTKAALGDSWESFLAWGQYRTVLYRHRHAEARGEGYSYPMMDQLPPDVLEKTLDDMAREHPTWNQHYKHLQTLQDQALLLDVLSGEHTVDEVIRMKEAHEDYWTLPRQMENLAMQQKAATGIHPTSGVRGQHGSRLPFVYEQDGIERKLYRHISAYYDIIAKQAMLRMQQQMREHSKWKQLPFAGRKFVESIMVPLRMDTTVAATLTEEELQQMAADAINGYLEREAGETLPEEMQIKPKDVVLDENNKPIFRRTAPRMANVISLFDPKHPGVRQYFYIPDRIIFMLQSQKGTNLLDWALPALTIGREITEPFKRELVQNLAFATRNVPRDITTGVVLAEDERSLAPGVTHVIGLVEDTLGKDAGERMAAELISRSMEGVHHEQHKGVWGSFVGAMSEGVVIHGYGDMTFPQRLVKAPGQIASTVLKPITFINWLTGGRYASSKGETAGRAGAYRIARDRGLSAASAQARFDRATGNFTQHTRNRAFAEMWRMMGFLNPAWQISWQMYDQALHPDPKVRQQFYAYKLPIVAAMGMAMSATSYLGAMALIAATSDDDEEKKRRQEEWKQRQRNRSNWSRARYVLIGLFKLPYEYGPIGALQSAAAVATMDVLLDGKVQLNRIADIAAARTSGVAEMLGDLLPVPMQVKTGIELALNYKFFFEEPVVDHRLREMYPDSPELQTWPDTPELYKTVGRTLGVSPEQIRHATRGIITSLGDDLVSTLSRAAEGKRVLGDEAADLPLIGRLMSREARGFASKPVQDLRKLVKEYDALLGEIKDHKRRGVDTNELEEQVKQLALARVMNSLVKDAWDEAKKERESASPDPELAMEHERQMTDLAARFFELVDGKTTNPELRERLYLSIVTAISRIGTPSQKDDESNADFAVRVKAANTRRERLFVAQATVATPLNLHNRTTETQKALHKILRNAAHTATSKPDGQDEWTVEWGRQSGQYQLLRSSGIPLKDAKQLLWDYYRYQKVDKTGHPYGSIPETHSERVVRLRRLYGT